MIETDLLRETNRLSGELLKGLVVMTWVIGLGFVALISILLVKLT